MRESVAQNTVALRPSITNQVVNIRQSLHDGFNNLATNDTMKQLRTNSLSSASCVAIFTERDSNISDTVLSRDVMSSMF